MNFLATITDPTAPISGTDALNVFNASGWTYALVGLGIMASLFGLGLFIRLIGARREDEEFEGAKEEYSHDHDDRPWE